MARLIERIPARPELTNRAVTPQRKIRLAAYARVSTWRLRQTRDGGSALHQRPH